MLVFPDCDNKAVFFICCKLFVSFFRSVLEVVIHPCRSGLFHLSSQARQEFRFFYRFCTSDLWNSTLALYSALELMIVAMSMNETP